MFGGRYEVIERIGAGGMAIVYKAKDTLLHRVVTIKVLRDQFASDQEFVRRFRREAQSAAGLSHPNIVSIYDVGKDGDTEYIVMEYIEGRNLKEVIRNYAPLSTEQAINLVFQIGEAISHAHEHHIIHRDIKPQNILVTPDGRAKVTDFGIARAVSSATLTHTGDIVGSVHYLSPEQARGTQTNEQTDIYSLGIILYELLTGRVPYDGETPITIALKHLQEPAILPSKINPRVPKDLESVIMKAISKSPDKRYQTAKDFLTDLRNIKAGRKVVYSEMGDEREFEVTQVHKTLIKDVEDSLSDKDATPKKRGNRKVWIWAVVSLGVLFLTFGGTWYGIKSFMAVGTTKVPNLEGYSIPEAEVLLRQANLKLNLDFKREYSDTIEKDRIIRQDPLPDSLVKVEREVQVVVSRGVEIIEFPNLKSPSLSEDDAKNAILNKGFTGEIKTSKQVSDRVPKGFVIDQDPTPNALWPKNGTVSLVISEGPELETITMPDVINKSAVEAQSILEDQLLVVSILTEISYEYPPDFVIRTDPEPGEPVKQGSQVTIIISQGPGPTASAGMFSLSLSQTRGERIEEMGKVND